MAQEEEKKEEFTKNAAKGMFASDEVIPDVVDTEPEHILSVEWTVDEEAYYLEKYGQEMPLKYTHTYTSY